MGKQVSTGGSLKCSMGTASATFKASEGHVKATSAAGVVTDVGKGNVPSFAMCKSLANPQVQAATTAASGTLTPQPCVPVLAPWTPGSKKVKIGGVAALDDSSKCSCTWGGVITVKSPGQSKVSLG